MCTINGQLRPISTRDRAIVADVPVTAPFGGVVPTLASVGDVVRVGDTVATAVRSVDLGENRKASALAGGAVSMGLVFGAVKVTEYIHAANSGHTPTSTLFFTYYFIVTGIHLLHLAFAALAMTVMAARLRHADGCIPVRERVFFECVASYWHLVDMLWIFIFPLLYLVR